jgi:hypothetical protein
MNVLHDNSAHLVKKAVALLRGSLAALAVLSAGAATAQDFPTLQGDAARTGLNTAVHTSGPGLTNLNWFKPDAGTAGQFERQVMSTEVSSTGTWTGVGPQDGQNEAVFVYKPVQNSDATENAFSGFTAYVAALLTNTAFDYRYALGVPSSLDPNQPTVAQTGTASSFSFKVEPAQTANRTPQTYGLYLWLPSGPTTIGGVPVFQQQDIVYQVTYGTGQVFTDVLNTFTAGPGFIRLGNGGAPTQRGFQYDGVDPIVITVFNTIPRDQFGNLIGVDIGQVVFADAVMAVPQVGYYTASPIVSAFDPSTGSGTVHTVGILNQVQTVFTAGQASSITTGTVTSYVSNTGVLRWTWQPVSVGTSTTYTDSTMSAVVAPGTDWTPTAIAVGQKGATYLTAPITNTLASASDTVYTPVMNDGSYQIQAWIPGNGSGQSFAKATQYEIHEGTTITTFTVDQSTASGWVTLSTRRFNQDNAHGAALTVHVTNFSALPGDAGNLAFTDAIQFIGQQNLAINSTPVQATVGIRTAVGGSTSPTAVTVVAAEDGRIYCLDSTGDGNGGTKLYWAYPSLASLVPDPNQVAGVDGPGPIAQMPQGFNLTSALVEHIGGNDYLYIGSANGRVYCIDMAGRGDGSTTRIWSFPDDYPATPAASDLGPIAGSVAFATNAQGPTIYVPAEQGRIFALNALGNGDSTTTLQWEFPNGSQNISAFGTFANDARNAGDRAWANPNNAKLQDATYATVVPDVGAGGTGQSEYLKCTAPATLNVPAGVTVTGIQIRVVRHRTAGDAGLTIKDANVELVKANVIQGTAARDRANTVDDWSTVDIGQFYGGEADLWGNTWTPADFTSGFGVVIAVTGNGNSTTNTVLPTASIDFVQVRVFYQSAQTTGAIIATPTVAFGNVYFGTLPGSDGAGHEIAINEDTGQQVWDFHGTKTWSTTATFVNADGFESSAVAIPGSELNNFDSAGTQVNTIVVANDNRFITALNAATGAGILSTETELWTTNVLGTPVVGNLSYTPQTVLDNSATGTTASAPAVIVPTPDGRFDSLFALWNGDNHLPVTGTSSIAPGGAFGATNRFGTRRAWEFLAASPIAASTAVGRGFMYGADLGGFFYAFGNGSSTSSSGAPGQQSQTENDAGFNGNGDDYRETKMFFCTAADYNTLRAGPAGITGTMINGMTHVPEQGKEWGETLYIVIWNFPYQLVSQPPIVNFQFDVEGISVRNMSVTSLGPITSPINNGPSGNPLDGYAVVAFPLQSGASFALPPGSAQVSASISTTDTTSPPRYVNVDLAPGDTVSSLNFFIANPISLAMSYTAPTTPDPLRAIGWKNDPSDAQNIINGSPDVATTAVREDLLTTEFNDVTHGQSAMVPMWIIDRSLMTLLHGPDKGLTDIRVQRSNLGFQGGISQVVAPIPVTPFNSFEDYPINIPNNSLDYPDLQREQVAIVSDPNGKPANPIFNGVDLYPPLITGSGTAGRVQTPTEFDFTLDVPLFQPANTTTTNDSAGVSTGAGYRGQFFAFVDSFDQGVLTTEGNRREAYRSFWVSTAVPVDQRFYVSTPTVDLGELAQGAGYANPSTDFTPWQGAYANMFKSFRVINNGNVNLLAMRVAKQTGQSSSLLDWAIPSSGNSDLAWLDALTNAASDIDPAYAITSPVILQKARVGDRKGPSLSTNPRRRSNANIGVLSSSTLYDSPPAADPKITVTVPFGFPVGTYTQTMRVVENDNGQLVLDGSNNPITAFSDPTFTLTFHVRESQLTGKPSPNVAPLVDNLLTGTEQYMYTSQQPAAIRDANGNLAVVWSSDRNTFTPTAEPTAPTTNSSFSLYAASLHGSTPSGSFSSPLNDLNQFVVSGTGTWFSKDVGPYPSASPASLFTTGLTGYSINPNAPVNFTWPAFPTSIRNPFTGTPNTTPYLAFVGAAQVNTGNVTIGSSKIFITPTTLSGTGTVSFGTLTDLPDNLTNAATMTGTVKQRPSIIQVGTNATVFYSTQGSGQGQVFYATFNGTAWTANVAMQLPASFDSVGSVSASARQDAGGNKFIELAIPAKLKGRPHADIFFGRLPCDANAVPTSSDLSNLSPISKETLTAEGEAGTFRAQGIEWDTAQPLVLYLNGTALSLTSPQVDQRTGIISYDNAVLGGRIFLDPINGTVRLSGTTVSPSTNLQLDYTPRLLRVSSGVTAVNHPTLLFDNRFIGDFSYWFNSGGTPVTTPTAIRQARYMFHYGSTSTGGGQASRPYMSTYRFGLQLPTGVATTSTGQITSLAVTGATSFYQVDPSNGRVYFTDADEGATATVTYTGVDAAGTVIGTQTATGRITLVTETREAPIPIQEAVNESQVTSMLDPFDFSPPFSGGNPARPGLIWLFWTSTRGGAPDVFFQTIAPQFKPVSTNR